MCLVCGFAVAVTLYSAWQLWQCHQKSIGRFWIVYSIHNYTYVYMLLGSHCHNCHGCHALINQQLSGAYRHPQDCHADCHTFRAQPVANVALPPQKHSDVFGTATPATGTAAPRPTPTDRCRPCADALPAWPGRTRAGAKRTKPTAADTVRGRVCDTEGGMGGEREPPAPGGPPVGSEPSGERSGTPRTNFFSYAAVFPGNRISLDAALHFPPCSEIYRSAPAS
jgi:hypothetical protein